MPIVGARKVDTRNLRPIIGIRFLVSKPNAKGTKIPIINIMVPPLTVGKGNYCHCVPIYTKSNDSEFNAIYKAVLGKYCTGTRTSGKKLAIELSNAIIDKAIGLKFMEVKDGNSKFRKWAGIEAVEMADHPGVGTWPAKSLPGDDLFQGQLSDATPEVDLADSSEDQMDEDTCAMYAQAVEE